MGALIESIQLGNGNFLWLDDYVYSGMLLANGNPPWLDPTAFVAWRQKAIGLLKPSINLLPLKPLLASWLAVHDALREDMAAKKRAVVPARTLLANEAFRGHVAELLASLSAALPSLPLVLSVPSPRAMLYLAYGHAHGDSAAANIEVGEDETDACAMYLADFLRSFGNAQVDAVLLTECADHEPTNDEELGWYQPVWNVAEHYRWDTGVGFEDGSNFSGSAPDLSIVLANQPVGTTWSGVQLNDSFWQGAAIPVLNERSFLALTVPEDAVPESVLARLAAARP